MAQLPETRQQQAGRLRTKSGETRTAAVQQVRLAIVYLEQGVYTEADVVNRWKNPLIKPDHMKCQLR